MKRHYIIRFNDLSQEKQNEIINDLLEDIQSDGDMKTKMLDGVEGDEFGHLDNTVRRACDQTWNEWEVVV
jgi:hypothetical protein